MAAKIITLSIQKGGTSKTTSTAILSYLLSENHKVLAVDMDSQGNLTEMLTQQDIYDFEDRTVFEAMQDLDARLYLHKVKENLYLLPAEDNLAAFSRHIYTKYLARNEQGQILLDDEGGVMVTRDASLVLKNTLKCFLGFFVIRHHHDILSDPLVGSVMPCTVSPGHPMKSLGLSRDIAHAQCSSQFQPSLLILSCLSFFLP